MISPSSELPFLRHTKSQFFQKFLSIFVMFISDNPSFFFKVISDSLLFYGKLLLLVIVICEMIFPSL